MDEFLLFFVQKTTTRCADKNTTCVKKDKKLHKDWRQRPNSYTAEINI